LKLTADEATTLAAPYRFLSDINARENTLRAQRKYAEIEPLGREGIEIAKRLYGENSQQLNSRRIRLAETLVMLGKFGEAEELARAVLAFRQKTGGTEMEFTWAHATLGSALVGLKRYAEAEPLLAPACESIRLQYVTSVSGTRGGGLMIHAPQLIQLYEATNRPQNAEEWKKYLAQQQEARAP
jgi:hypothetical protein